MYSALIKVFPGDEGSSIFHSCIGIDVQASAPAPGGEVVRVEIDPLDRHPLALKALKQAIGSLEPLFVSGGQLLAILE
jgi:hypothetical protein